MVKVFISHAHEDQPLADALRTLMHSVFGPEEVEVCYSTAPPDDGGIRPGEEWFPWITDRIQESQIALLLLTPVSISRPWLLWESGAVSGMALATHATTSIIPPFYSIDVETIPAPLRFRMAIDGALERDVRALLNEVHRHSPDKLLHFSLACDRFVPEYMSAVDEAIREVSLHEKISNPSHPFRLQEWGQSLSYPVSVIKISWNRMTDRENGIYVDDDLKEAPWVFDGNHELLELYQISASENESPAETLSRLHMTFAELVDQLKKWMAQTDLDRFLKDQDRLRRLLIFQDSDARRFRTPKNSVPIMTEAPIVFPKNRPDGHPTLAGKTFLPCLLSKRRDGPFPDRPHDTYLLVAYVDVTFLMGSAAPVS